MERPQPLIVTTHWHSDRRATPDLCTLQLVPPSAFLDPQANENRSPGYHWPDDQVYVVNFNGFSSSPISCFAVRCNGKLISYKRRPEIHIPWAYGAVRTRHAVYGRFVSLDRDTWDLTQYRYAPYRILSILTAAERRNLARLAKKGAN